jgi:hypothetical protein
MRSAESWRERLVCRLALDRNPLRRVSDRVEAWFVLMLVTAFVPLAVLATVSTADWVYASGAREVKAGSSLRQVTAVLTEAAPASAAPVPGSALIWTPARWKSDGMTRIGAVPAAPGSIAKSSVSIWVDAGGQAEPPPLTAGQLSARVTLAAMMAPFVVGLGLLLLWSGLRCLLDRRRLAAWSRAWSLVGPRWTR